MDNNYYNRRESFKKQIRASHPDLTVRFYTYQTIAAVELADQNGQAIEFSVPVPVTAEDWKETEGNTLSVIKAYSKR